MELTFLSENFTPISFPIDTAISVVWSLRMEECGTFAATLPLTEGMTAGYTPGELLTLAYTATYLRDNRHCGRIESVFVEEGLLRLEGRTLECLLYDRVSAADTAFAGRADQAAAHMLDTWGEDLAVTRDPFPAVGEAGSFLMEAGENLGKWLHRVLSPLGAVLTVELCGDGAAHLTLRLGVDRSLDSADTVSRAIFSEGFGNIASLEEEQHTAEACDRLYIQGGDGTVVTVDRAGAAENPLRREGYRVAADIRPGTYASTAAYRSALEARGRELLGRMGVRRRLTCVAESDALPRYGTDYALGDICEVHAETLGLRRAARLVALDIVQEAGIVRLYPSFGDEVVRVKTMLG